MNLQNQIEERLREQNTIVELIRTEANRIQSALDHFRALVGPDLKVDTTALVGNYRAPGSGYLYSVESVLSYQERLIHCAFAEQAEYLRVLRSFTRDKIEECYSRAVAASPVLEGFVSRAGRAEVLK